MNKIFNVIILCLFFFHTGCQSISFSKVSKKISLCQLTNGIRKSGFNDFHQTRMKLVRLGKMPTFNKSDTLFLVESSEIQSGEFFGQIWNAHSELIYSYVNDEFLFKNDKIYTRYMLTLIKKWDIQEIKKEEVKNSKMIPNNPISASRIIYSNNKIKVECVSFRDFFDLERDRFDNK